MNDCASDKVGEREGEYEGRYEDDDVGVFAAEALGRDENEVVVVIVADTMVVNAQDAVVDSDVVCEEEGNIEGDAELLDIMVFENVWDRGEVQEEERDIVHVPDLVCVTFGVYVVVWAMVDDCVCVQEFDLVCVAEVDMVADTEGGVEAVHVTAVMDNVHRVVNVCVLDLSWVGEGVIDNVEDTN